MQHISVILVAPYWNLNRSVCASVANSVIILVAPYWNLNMDFFSDSCLANN